MPKPSSTRAFNLATTMNLVACQQLTNLIGVGTVPGRETGAAGPSAGGIAAAQRTDHDMSRVIIALTALDARPIESLSVEAARRQPTPADAMRRVLQESGQSTTQRPVAQVRDISVPTPAGPIPARVYGPARDGPAVPLIIYWHDLLARRRLGDRRPRHPRRLSPPCRPKPALWCCPSTTAKGRRTASRRRTTTPSPDTVGRCRTRAAWAPTRAAWRWRWRAKTPAATSPSTWPSRRATTARRGHGTWR